MVFCLFYQQVRLFYYFNQKIHRNTYIKKPPNKVQGEDYEKNIVTMGESRQRTDSHMLNKYHESGSNHTSRPYKVSS